MTMLIDIKSRIKWHIDGGSLKDGVKYIKNKVIFRYKVINTKPIKTYANKLSACIPKSNKTMLLLILVKYDIEKNVRKKTEKRKEKNTCHYCDVL